MISPLRALVRAKRRNKFHFWQFLIISWPSWFSVDFFFRLFLAFFTCTVQAVHLLKLLCFFFFSLSSYCFSYCFCPFSMKLDSTIPQAIFFRFYTFNIFQQFFSLSLCFEKMHLNTKAKLFGYISVLHVLFFMWYVYSILERCDAILPTISNSQTIFDMNCTKWILYPMYHMVTWDKNIQTMFDVRQQFQSITIEKLILAYLCDGVLLFFSFFRWIGFKLTFYENLCEKL